MWQWCVLLCLLLTSFLPTTTMASNLPFQGIGTAFIYLQTHHATTLHIYIPHSLYVPDLPCNLISPQWLFQTLQKQNKKSSFPIFPNGCLFIINNHIIPLQYHPQSNLPIFWLLQNPQHTVALLASDSLATIPLIATPSLWLHNHCYSVNIVPSLSNNTRLLCQYNQESMLTLQLACPPRTHELCLNPKPCSQGPRDTLCLGYLPPTFMPRMPIWQSKMTLFADQQKIGEWLLQPSEMCCINQMIAGCLGLP